MQRASPSPAPRAPRRRALTPKPRLGSLTGAAERPATPYRSRKPPAPASRRWSRGPWTPRRARGLPRHAAVHDIIAKTAPTMGPVRAAPLAPSEAHSPLLSSSHRPYGAGAGPGSSRDTASSARGKRPGRRSSALSSATQGAELQPPRSAAAFWRRTEWKPGGRGRNGLATPACLTTQKEPKSDWDVPAPHGFGVTQQPPIPQGSMAGSTPKRGCIDPAGNRRLGKVPGKGQAAWDGAVGRAAGLHPPPQGQAPEEGCTRKPWGQVNASSSSDD